MTLAGGVPVDAGVRKISDARNHVGIVMSSILKTLARPILELLFLGLIFAAPAWAGVVTSTADSGTGSLRAVLGAAVSGDTITFTVPSPSTIALTGGELPITTSVTISGPGANALSIVNASGRVFNLDTSGKTVLISGMHLSGQNPSGNGGAIINNGGALTLQYVLIDNSSTTGEGGAIENNYNGSVSYSLTIQNSTIANNTANKAGAIAFIGCDLRIENSTIYGNHATDSFGAMTLFSGCGYIYNSSIVGNTAAFSVGGINSQSSALTIESSILANNTDVSGINDLNRTGGGNSFVYASHSIFSESFVPADNVLNGSDISDQIGVDPQLGALANNGGTTPTLRPGPTSPAIGVGSNSQGYANDQRGAGFARNADPSGATGNVDIGAIQRYVPAAPPPAPTPALGVWGLVALVAMLSWTAWRRRRAASEVASE